MGTTLYFIAWQERVVPLNATNALNGPFLRAARTRGGAAPARRTLDARGAKYSTMVLDGSAIDPTDVIVVGVNQVQRAGSEVWWRADLQAAAQSAASKKKP